MVARILVIVGLSVLSFWPFPPRRTEEDRKCADLVEAVAQGDEAAVRAKLQESPALVNCITGHPADSTRWTPLTRAAHAGKTSMLNLLIESGADVDLRGYWRATALYHAVQEGHQACVRLLLEAGADPALPDERGSVPILLALYNDDLEIVRLLLDHGAERNARVLAALGDTDALEALLSEDPEALDSREHDPMQTAPLHWAARFGHLEVVMFLVESGAWLDVPDGGLTFAADRGLGLTPLGWAAWKGHRDVVRYLIASGAEFDALSGAELSPLSLAAWMGHYHIVADLLDKGASISVPVHLVDLEETPLHYAADGGCVRSARLLIERGAPVDPKNLLEYPQPVLWVESRHQVDQPTRGPRYAETMVRDAYGSGNRDRVELKQLAWVWKELDEEPGVRCYHTPLQRAARRGQTAVAFMLLEAGADPASGYYGTPLHWAAGAGHLDTTRLLLEHDADPGAHRDILGTPLHWAAREGQTGTADVLLRHGADLEAGDGNGRTPLHLAALYGQADFVGWATEAGASVHATDDHGDTPLALAEKEEHTDVVEYLREHRQRQ